VSSKGSEESLTDINKNWKIVLLRSHAEMFGSGFSDALVKKHQLHPHSSLPPFGIGQNPAMWQRTKFNQLNLIPTFYNTESQILISFTLKICPDTDDAR